MTQVYLWEPCKNYPRKYWGLYDRDRSFDRFNLFKIRQLSTKEVTPKPTIVFKVSKQKLLKYNRLNNYAEPLVSPRCQEVLASTAGDYVQFIPTTLECTDGIIDDYVIVNVTQAIDGIDLEASDYDTILDTGHICSFNRLILKPNRMEGIPIAKDINNEEQVLVSQELVDAFKKAKLNAGQFFDPYQYYFDLTAGKFP